MKHSRHAKEDAKAHGRRYARRGYHHGNLREALVAAARQLILEKGPHGFSLIEAARLADVSPAAPYRHFKDKDALLEEVARQGYDRFSDALAAAWDDGQPDTLAALHRMGQAYLDFARTERASYAAMFEAGIAIERGSDLETAAGRAYEALSKVAEEIADGDVNGADVPAKQIFFHIWSLAHGAATLSAGAVPGGGISRAEAEDLLDDGVNVYLRGLKKG